MRLKLRDLATRIPETTVVAVADIDRTLAVANTLQRVEDTLSAPDDRWERLPGSYHGSGCTLASALAGRIALGEALHGAVQSALDYTWRTLRDAESPGHGQYVPRRLPTDFCH